ncbi:MAG TPA: CDP-diacylglycerol--glycerol-3-phosphate 3-phosphatidyltransferase [Burkholderiales bacterium]|nr:CDP-diacylglycerol--glycerol-3-phosphate 3-phosphatidyltransferase [Pseudomonadota bacterium]HVC48718.1 CDP-diacylglycerol--glycerol-3-phosphate 3-phosphatidyltransferase [Burkholderiales bacterium]
MPLNIPNLLTYLRILLVPVFTAVFYLPGTWLAPHWVNTLGSITFILAALTDWLDGYLARKLNQMSAFGAFLDPVADKLMVAAALIILVEINRVGAFIALIIIGREIAISALREWMAQIGKRKSVAVSFIGKIKTASQMVAISLLLYHDPIIGGIKAQLLGTLLIYVAAILTLWSMIYYLRIAMPELVSRQSAG